MATEGGSRSPRSRAAPATSVRVLCRRRTPASRWRRPAPAGPTAPGWSAVPWRADATTSPPTCGEGGVGEPAELLGSDLCLFGSSALPAQGLRPVVLHEWKERGVGRLRRRAQVDDRLSEVALLVVADPEAQQRHRPELLVPDVQDAAECRLCLPILPPL